VDNRISVERCKNVAEVTITHYVPEMIARHAHNFFLQSKKIKDNDKLLAVLCARPQATGSNNEGQRI
jgi:hypothetical protein